MKKRKVKIIIFSMLAVLMALIICGFVFNWFGYIKQLYYDNTVATCHCHYAYNANNEGVYEQVAEDALKTSREYLEKLGYSEVEIEQALAENFIRCPHGHLFSITSSAEVEAYEKYMEELFTTVKQLGVQISADYKTVYISGYKNEIMDTTGYFKYYYDEFRVACFYKQSEANVPLNDRYIDIKWIDEKTGKVIHTKRDEALSDGISKWDVPWDEFSPKTGDGSKPLKKSKKDSEKVKSMV